MNRQVATTDELVIRGFDEGDVEYLVTHFTTEHLRWEIHNAELQQSAAICFGNDDEFYWWRGYTDICKTALQSLGANQPKLGNDHSTVKAVKEQHDIVEVISEYTKLTKSGKSQFYGKCPFHNDSNPSLGVNKEKQVFHCLSCHKKGDVINFVMEIEHLDTKQACHFLADRYLRRRTKCRTSVKRIEQRP